MKRSIHMSKFEDLEYKNKLEDRATPPRSSSPIPESVHDAPVNTTVSPDEVNLKVEDDEKEKVAKDKEPIYTTVKKKQKVELEEQEEKKEQDEQKSEEMVNEEIKEETKKDDHDGAETKKDDFELPDLPTSTKKLQHVTKGRARPTRRVKGKPVVRETETDRAVDDFFTATLQTTDFDKVPTLSDEKKEVEREAQKPKTPKRPTAFALPGMAAITPDMLKRKKKPTEVESKEKEEEGVEPVSPKKSVEKSEDEEEKNGEADVEEKAPKSPDPATKRRPPGAMGLPGMGFGSNMFAEMKLKKLNKNVKSPEHSHDKVEEVKNGSEQAPIPFGRSMLKKTNHPTSPPSEKTTEANNNNNNNKEWTQLKSTPDRWKSRSFNRDEKPIITLKSPTKAPLMPTKPSPPPLTTKPGSLRGKPPPLPSKPKPAALRPDSDLRGGRARPMSEFVDPKKVPSNVRLRAASWGKKEKSEEEDKK